MKKNITINLCGRLFAIDEDAYEMLATYEQSLRNYFRTREGGEEIAEDLEARIAELFDELKAKGVEAITIDHVREVIHRIGRPEEMEEQPTPERPTPNPSPREGSSERQNTSGNESPSLGEGIGVGRSGGLSSKRLYRNPDDKKLMGVLSGFAAYFGGDVLWWRLGYAAIVLLSFAGSSYNFLWFLPHHHLYFHIYFWGIALIIAYIVLAVLMPVAETPEDRLRMKGKEVNPQNLAEEVANSRPTSRPPYEGGSGYQISEEGASSQMHSTPLPNREGQGGGSRPSGCLGCIGGFFVALWTVVSTLFRWSIYAFGAFLAVMCLIGIVCLTAFAVNPFEFLKEGDSFFRTEEFAALVPTLTVPFYISVVAAGIVLAITAYALIHSLLNEFKQMPSMPYRQRIALLVMWIAGLAVAGAAIGYGFPKLIKASEEYNRQEWQKHDARERAENTHDGIYVQPHEWNFLQDNGWKILNAEGCNDRFTAYGEHLSGDRDVRYLDCYDDNHRQRLRVERTDTLQPGTYRLTCAARANGTGACIYVIVGNQKPQFIEIPATGNTGGDIWVEADKFVRFHNHDVVPSDSAAYVHKQCELVGVNGQKGYGWNRIAFEPIRITAPTVIRYGLTSDNAFTGRTWLGQWFSATDFEVSRVE